MLRPLTCCLTLLTIAIGEPADTRPPAGRTQATEQHHVMVPGTDYEVALGMAEPLPLAARRCKPPTAEVQRGTEVCTCTLTVQGVAGVCPVQSQIENYRAKAKEFARLTVVAKSLRHSRQYRKLAEMYWALALGEEPDRAQPSKANVKRNTT